MKKLLATSVVALAMTTLAPTVNAGDSGDFVRLENTRLNYSIDHDTCKVSLKTNRNIRRITQRDASGNIIKRWSTRKGDSLRLFTDLDKFPGSLLEGTIKVKTGYKNRVKFHEIGDQFRADLEDCLAKGPDAEPPVVVCPFESQIQLVAAGEISLLDNNENFCSLFSDTGEINIFNGETSGDFTGLRFFQTSLGCAPVGNPNTPLEDQCINEFGEVNPIESGALGTEEIAACLAVVEDSSGTTNGCNAFTFQPVN